MIKRYWILGIVFIWFFGALFFLAFFANSGLSHFDPTGRLTNASQNLHFDQTFVDSLKGDVGNLQSTVVHFEMDDCQCNQIAAEHKASVALLATEQYYTNKVIKVSQFPSVTQWLPSVPAVAVIEDDGRLAYLGPYSAGYSCSAGNGIVERYIEVKPQKMNNLPASIVTDTLGCYCNIPVI